MQNNSLVWAAQELLRAPLNELLARETEIRRHYGTAQDLSEIMRGIATAAAQVRLSKDERVAIEIRRREADQRWSWLAFHGVEERGTEIAYRDDALEVLTLRSPGFLMRDCGDLCLMSWRVGDATAFRREYGNADAFTVAKTKAYNHVQQQCRVFDVGGDF